MNTLETIRKGYVDEAVEERMQEILRKRYNIPPNHTIRVFYDVSETYRHDPTEREARTEREPSYLSQSPLIPYPTSSISSIPDASTSDIIIQLSVANDIVAIIDMHHLDDEAAENYVKYRDALRDELSRRPNGGPMSPDTQSLRYKSVKDKRIHASTETIKEELEYLDAAIKAIEYDMNIPDSEAECYRDIRSSLKAELNRRTIEDCKLVAKTVRGNIDKHSDELVDLTKCSTGNLKCEIDHLNAIIQALTVDDNDLDVLGISRMKTDARSYAEAKKKLQAELKRRGENYG
jgi:hypothetical protein